MTVAARAERRLLRGWGRALGSVAEVIPVACTEDVVATLADGGARGAVPRGLGRSYGDAALNAGGHVLDTTSLRGATPPALRGDRVTVDAGASIGELVRDLVPRGWFVPVTPGTRHVTVGGAIAADVHGKNHPTDGSFGRHVESFRLVTPAGVHEVDDRTDPETFRATVGGMGLTGVITRATLRLRPVETAHMRVTDQRVDDLDATLAALESAAARYAVAWIDASVGGTRLGRGVVSTADHALRHELPASEDRDPLALGPERRPVAPPVPVRLVHRASVRLFNRLRWQAAPRRPTARVAPLTSFFYPLDRVSDWPVLYGPRGFVQYQFVVPPGEARLLTAVLEALVREPVPCGLAVLKRLGPGDGAPLSFPMEGWTLAVDLPVAVPRLRELVTGFDRAVAAAGGRVYLAKDACLSPDTFPTMYPHVDSWQRVRDRVDPERRLRSDLGRRLGLTPEGGDAG